MFSRFRVVLTFCFSLLSNFSSLFFQNGVAAARYCYVGNFVVEIEVPTPPPGLVTRLYKRWLGRSAYVGQTPMGKGARIRDVNKAPPAYSPGLLVFYRLKYHNPTTGLSSAGYSRWLFVSVPLHSVDFCERGRLF